MHDTLIKELLAPIIFVPPTTLVRCWPPMMDKFGSVSLLLHLVVALRLASVQVSRRQI